jgi:foldase protein PrsA
VKKMRQVLSLLLLLTLAAGMIFTTGCSKKGPSNTTVVTIDDHKINMDEFMYYIYTVETTGAYYDKLYQQNFGSSYWDLKQDGKTMRDTAKEYIMYSAVMYDILYDKAKKEGGYDLTDDELKKNQADADQLLKGLSKDQLEKTGFTKDSLLKTMEKISMGEKYYNKVVKDLNLDDKAIKDSVKFDDYRQYNTEYLFAPTTKYDDKGNMVNLSEEEQTKALESITAALDKVKAGQSFTDIAKEDTTLKTEARNFVYGDGTAETEYQDAAKALENNKYTENFVKTAYGYYIIQMLNNKATDSYDKAVNDAKTSKETSAFKTEFEKMKKDYKITTNNEVWDPIVIGQLTLAASNTADESANSAKSTPAATGQPAKDNTTESNTSESK